MQSTDKRVVLAAGLSILILLLWSRLGPQPPALVEPPPQDAPAIASTTAEPEEALPAPTLDEIAPSESVEATAIETIEYSTDLVDVVMTNRGARVVSWKLKAYTSRDGAPLELLPQYAEGSASLLDVEIDDYELARTINEAPYRVERIPVDDGTRFDFHWADGRGVEVRKSLTLREGSYLADVALRVTDRGRRLPASVAIGPGFGAQEPGKKHGTYHYASQGLWNQSGDVTRSKRKKLVGEPREFESALTWAGLEDQYFTAVVIPRADRAEVGWRDFDRTPIAVADGDEVEARGEPLFAVSVPADGALLYVGPKKYTLLRDQGHELEKTVWFATNRFLAWIAKSIFLAVVWIHDHTIHNWGLAIVLSTFLLRLVLFPVNQYSMVSMKKTQLQMQRLQPKIKAIRKKYSKNKDIENRNKMNQEMMDLYRSEGVNPAGGLSGCLPLLAQFPILIGFYNMLTVAIELRGAPFFGWIQDLSQSDPLWIFPLAMGATMFLQQKMAMSKVKDPVQQQQQKVMMIMPFFFTWICLNMPAGMVLYWFVNNVLGIGQQWLVNRHTSRLEAATQKA